MAARALFPSLRDRLRSGEPLLGTFVKSSDPSIAELLAAARVDYLIIDLEHSGLSVSAVAEIIRAAELWNVPALVRFSPDRVHEAGVALEAGAAGIQVTHVTVPAALAKARRAVTLAPDGELGLALSHHAAGFGRSPASDYVARLRDEIAIVAQIESRSGVEALPELLAMRPAPDAWFLGPVDLSADLGHPGEVSHPDVQETLTRAAQMILTSEQRLSVFADDIEHARRWRELGATAVTLGSDYALLSRRIADDVRAWRETASIAPNER